MRLTKSNPTGGYSYLSDGVSPASDVLSDGYSAFTPGISEINGAGSRFYLADAQGNSRGLLDGGQGNPDGYNWDAFGNSVSRFGTNPTAYAWNEEAGYQSDNDSGLKLLGHRYLDSRTGRFISQDPAGDGDNWYMHADNDPMDEDDPDGLSANPNPSGAWSPYGGTQSDGNWAVGNIEADSGSTRNLWAETNHIWIVNYSPGIKAGSGQDGYNTGSEIDRVNWAVPGWDTSSTIIANLTKTPGRDYPPESLGHYFWRQLLSGGQADGSHFVPAGGVTTTRGAGPSGKAKIHYNRSSTKKEAFEKAKRAGAPGRNPIHEARPAVGDPHYHPVDGSGQKIENGVHYSYPP